MEITLTLGGHGVSLGLCWPVAGPYHVTRFEDVIAFWVWSCMLLVSVPMVISRIFVCVSRDYRGTLPTTA